MNRNATAVLVIGSLLASGPLAALSLGQIDTFEGTTTQGWTAGMSHPTPPINVANGGPNGAGDNYLQVNALGGSGPGSRLAAFNRSQWAGNYTASGITFISLDLWNQGPSDLSLRLLFLDSAGGTPSNVAFSTLAILLPAGSNWRSVLFPILDSDLTANLGTSVIALSRATELRIFHSTLAEFPGDSVVGGLGIDNICAVGVNGSAVDCAGGGGTTVPEPGTLVLLGLALAGLGLTRKRKAN